MNTALNLLRSRLARAFFCTTILTLAAPLPSGAGNVIGWGNNSAGQIQIPVVIGPNAVAVGAGGAHSLAVKSDGGVVSWGFNIFNQTNVPAGLSNVVAVTGGEKFSLALRTDGTVEQWGSLAPQPAGLTNVVEIAAGRDHALARMADGSLVSWGSVSNVPGDLTAVTGIGAGDGYNLAVQQDGKVAAWGELKPVTTELPPTMTNVVAVAGGYEHAVALLTDGRVLAWGSNSNGQCNVPAGLTGVVRVAAGAEHTVVLKSDTTIVAWGASNFQQTPAPAITNVSSLAAGAHHNLVVRSDGSPVIHVQPRDTTAIISRSAALRVMASGTPPLRYQWQKDGTNVPGATTSTLAFTSAQPANEGFYKVTVTNLFGRVTSAQARFKAIGEVPHITVQPKDVVAFCGDNVTLAVAAEGSTPLRYQWVYEGLAITGATGTRLSLSNVNWTNGGFYWTVVTNAHGAETSSWASLSIEAQTPTITSALTAAGSQGQNFAYTIKGQHSPIYFSATNLPAGLTNNPATGLISGIPLENGTFGPVIGAGNLCAWDYKTLVITIASALPVITSADQAEGAEVEDFAYNITASNTPTGYDAWDLPWGLFVDPLTGLISGIPVYAGEYQSTLLASNIWGSATKTLNISITNAPIEGLSMDNVTYNYSSPYLLDFQFSLRDNEDPAIGKAVVVDPRLLTAICIENNVTNSVSEGASIIARGSAKFLKTHIVLDFTESVASLLNGDEDFDGVSDAVETMVKSAKDFVSQQRAGSQVGVYEFHRDDEDPQKVADLTSDKTALIGAIDGIWTNYVQGYSGASRAWDAVAAAITDLGETNSDEEHFVVLISDGRDESSTAKLADIITSATNNHVKVYCLGFGSELDEAPLKTLSTQTDGRYYAATETRFLASAFDQIQRDLAGQYILRWATLKRSSAEFMPSFKITYQNFAAASPPNPVSIEIDDSVTPPETNYITNFIIAPYNPDTYKGVVTEGALRLVPDADNNPDALILRATYTPRHIRQILIHYRPNWPCVVELMSTLPGEMLSGWTMTQTNDIAGDSWLTLSAGPTAGSIPFAAFGNLAHFSFQDIVDPTTAFALFEIENSLYPPISKISLVLDPASVADFVTDYPTLPHGTPVPWLELHGLGSDPVQDELDDPDFDGVPTWQE